MGLWNDLDEQKVMMMKLAPNSENTEETRDVVCKISSSRVVHAIVVKIVLLVLLILFVRAVMSAVVYGESCNFCFWGGKKRWEGGGGAVCIY